MSVNALSELIEQRKQAEGWNDPYIEEASGGAVTKQQLSAWRRRGHREFPEPASLAALARVLRVPVRDVVLAAAASVGLDVLSVRPAFADLLSTFDLDHLTPKQEQALLSLVEAMLRPGLRVAPADEGRPPTRLDAPAAPKRHAERDPTAAAAAKRRPRRGPSSAGTDSD